MGKMKKILFSLLKNNKHKFGLHKFQFFISEKLDSLLEPLFAESKEKYQIYLKMILF